jgi:hypothetical protein
MLEKLSDLRQRRFGARFGATGVPKSHQAPGEGKQCDALGIASGV